MTSYIAGYNPDPYRGGRHTHSTGKLHAKQPGNDFARCKPDNLVVLAVEPEQPFTDIEPERQCSLCAKFIAREITAVEYGQRATREQYDRRKRDRLIQHQDHCIATYMRALDTGGINNRRGNGPRSTATMVSYHGTLDGLFQAKGNAPWDRLDPTIIHTFLFKPMQDGKPRDHKTINQNWQAINSFYEFAIDRELIEGRSPMKWVGKAAPTEGTGRGERPPVAEDDWRAVIESRLDPNERLFLGLGYYCGLRVSEAVIVRPHNVDTLHRLITFWRRKGGKTLDGLPYGDLVELLQVGLPHLAVQAEEWLDVIDFTAKYRHDQETLVETGSPYQPEQWWRDRFQHHILPRAGLHPKAFTPHNLRHSFGTNMVNCDATEGDVQDWMSHSDRETTGLYVSRKGRASKLVNELRARRDAGVTDLSARRESR